MLRFSSACKMNQTPPCFSLPATQRARMCVWKYFRCARNAMEMKKADNIFTSSLNVAGAECEMQQALAEWDAPWRR